MNITPDANILVRVVVEDDPQQTKAAKAVLSRAELIALTLPVLCEFTWVLAKGYKAARSEIAEAIRRISNSANVVANRAAIDAGLTILENGGDFADGVIEYEGRWLGGETFVTFDRHAATLLGRVGKGVHVPE